MCTWQESACAYICRWIREDSQKGRSFLMISHRLDPLVSIVDYWVEMTATGLKHLKEVSISRPIKSLGIEDEREVLFFFRSFYDVMGFFHALIDARKMLRW